MIISASRRTDIPAFYSDWFFSRLAEGYCVTKNPYNNVEKQISLKKEDVEGIVFWTKNPEPMLPYLDKLDGYPYYFQFTLNSYGTDIEPNVPPKGKHMVSVFKELAAKIGSNHIVWRYDPILINDKYTVEYHKTYFAELAERLQGCFRHCVISFVDIYGKNKDYLTKSGIRAPTTAEIEKLMDYFSKVAEKYNFTIYSCSEAVDLDKYNIKHGKCIDADILSELSGTEIKVTKDKNQRSSCGCAPSIDIGTYNSCTHNCVYCYANSLTQSRKITL